MHGTTMVFLAIMPFGSAFFNYMVPLQIGARDVAFPRLNALSFWMFLAGGILLHTSFLAGTPPPSAGSHTPTSPGVNTHRTLAWISGRSVFKCWARRRSSPP